MYLAGGGANAEARQCAGAGTRSVSFAEGWGLPEVRRGTTWKPWKRIKRNRGYARFTKTLECVKGARVHRLQNLLGLGLCPQECGREVLERLAEP